MPSAKLDKMRIEAYSEPDFAESSKISDAEFTVQVNPESYTLSYEVVYNQPQSSGTSGTQQSFDRIKPGNLEFEFLFDKTGAIPKSDGSPDSDENGVTEDIETFKSIVLGYMGEMHQPPYLMLSWGTLVYKCVCLGVDINYKLFKGDGTPMRAMAKAKFEDFVENELRLRGENNQSPDLTHVRFVKLGDTLPLMTEAIYGDPKYYMDIARINRLIDFRNLQVGQKIVFPPLEKS